MLAHAHERTVPPRGIRALACSWLSSPMADVQQTRLRLGEMVGPFATALLARVGHDCLKGARYSLFRRREKKSTRPPPAANQPIEGEMVRASSWRSVLMQEAIYSSVLLIAGFLLWSAL